MKESVAFDELMVFISCGAIQLDGNDGFIPQLIGTGLERGLKLEFKVGFSGIELIPPIWNWVFDSNPTIYETA